MTLAEDLVWVAIVNFGIQWMGWSVAAYFETEIFYDLIGALTHVILCFTCLIGSTGRSIPAYLIIIWATRLGIFLFHRILTSDGRDRRFNRIRTHPLRFLAAWTMQGIWIMCNLLPSLLSHFKKANSSSGQDLSLKEVFGICLWFLGFSIEVLADHQKKLWRQNSENHGRFINTGLWSVSRHPNFFGEILLWFGLFVSASAAFQGWEYVCVLCPIFNFLLITKISGIPPLEQYGRAKWGKDSIYQKYLKETPVLIPKLHRM